MQSRVKLGKRKDERIFKDYLILVFSVSIFIENKFKNVCWLNLMKIFFKMSTNIKILKRYF